MLQKRLAKDRHWDSVQFLEQVDEVFEEEVSDLDLPVELNEDECESFVQSRGLAVLHLRKHLKQAEHEFNRDDGECLLDVPRRPL